MVSSLTKKLQGVMFHTDKVQDKVKFYSERTWSLPVLSPIIAA